MKKLILAALGYVAYRFVMNERNPPAQETVRNDLDRRQPVR